MKQPGVRAGFGPVVCRARPTFSVHAHPHSVTHPHPQHHTQDSRERGMGWEVGTTGTLFNGYCGKLLLDTHTHTSLSINVVSIAKCRQQRRHTMAARNTSWPRQKQWNSKTTPDKDFSRSLVSISSGGYERWFSLIFLSFFFCSAIFFTPTVDAFSVECISYADTHTHTHGHTDVSPIPPRRDSLSWVIISEDEFVQCRFLVSRASDNVLVISGDVTTEYWRRFFRLKTRNPKDLYNINNAFNSNRVLYSPQFHIIIFKFSTKL